jgi:hypothetical protein
VPLATYAQLQSSIGDWLNRADLAAAIPSFISIAEAAHNRQLRTRQMIKRSTAAITDAFTSLPSDMLEICNAEQPRDLRSELLMQGMNKTELMQLVRL